MTTKHGLADIEYQDRQHSFFRIAVAGSRCFFAIICLVRKIMRECPVSIKIYSFYNNKGGVGKTTLCQNAACLFAEQNPEKQILVIDLCPQANVSQFLLGGGHAGYETNQKLQAASSRRNIVGFMDWLIKGNSAFTMHSGIIQDQRFKV